MTKRYIRFFFYITLIFFGLFLGSIITKSIFKTNPPYILINNDTKIENVLNLIESHYVDSIDTKKITTKVINSILDKLDPHSEYIDAEKFITIEENMQGSFSGIGVQFNIINDSIVVIAPISGGPSKKLGIRSGDRIIEVEGENVASINIRNEGVIKRLRGEKGSAVNIKVFRPNYHQIIDFKIIRDDIPLYSVDAAIMMTNDIGYIKVNRFSATTFEEFIKGADKLLNNGMKKLILDLRGNPGGYLNMAINIADAILDKGQLIVYTQGRNRERTNIYSTSQGILQKTKVIVLIDEGSASASEIVSGAIQDNDRGTLIGRRSFGKGLVQEQISLTDGSVIRLTTQRYYTPSGRCIQKEYGESKEEYYLESLMRNKKEKVNDSLIFTTKNGRLVYGGGGITPDIIINTDSTLNYSKINLMIAEGWLSEFCLQHSLSLKKEHLNTTQTQFINTNADDIYPFFLQFIKEKNTDLVIDFGNKELSYLKILLKATVARNIWDDEIYFKILNTNDEFIQTAINSFK